MFKTDCKKTSDENELVKEGNEMIKNANLIFKKLKTKDLDSVAPLVEDPNPANSTIDTDTHPLK